MIRFLLITVHMVYCDGDEAFPWELGTTDRNNKSLKYINKQLCQLFRDALQKLPASLVGS